ncbi:MAG TPA: branched-chain amino acid ABC transporter permease [Actinomycetota bacterium]|nr:branched-chain amino acid ABC transporter permease [Actinomycetota bacterium]
MGTPIRRGVEAGLIGGLVLVYLAMVGMITKFDELVLIGTQVTLGLVLLALPPLGAALAAARPRVVGGRVDRLGPLEGLTAGVTAGAITGGVIAAWLVVVDRIGIDRVRSVFIAVSPALVDVLTFGRGIAGGVAILIVGGSALGALGGAWRSLRFGLRRPVAIGVGVVLLMGMLQRIVPTILDELNIERDWLYSKVTRGLTWMGATIVFVVAAATAAFWIDRRERTAAARAEPGRADTRGIARTVGLVAIVAAAIVLPHLAGSIVSEILGTVGVYVLLALGLNVVTGYGGMLHLGISAFFLIGAYASALLTGANLVTAFGLVAPRFSANLNFYVALVVVVIIGAIVGALLAAPVLRLRGDYLAIVTLAFASIAVILATSNWLQPITGGPQGLRDVTDAPLFGISFQDPQNFYYLVLFFCSIAVYISWRLAWSRTGRAWNAMREDEQVADAMGVNTSRYKLLGFAIGGAMAAVGGALFSVKVGTVQPGSFEILVSITVLAVVILGGLGSVPGVVVGALVLLGLPGLLSQLEEYRLLIYGGALVAIMILRPQGLIPNVRRSRELQEEERTQDAWQEIFAQKEQAAAEQADAATAAATLEEGS